MKTYINIIRTLKYFFWISILTSAFFSCEDDLETQSFGQPVVEDFYKTPEQAEQALTAAYSPMNELAGSNFWGTMGLDVIFGEIGTDDFIKGGRTVENNAPLFQKDNWAVTTTNAVLEPLWNINYKGILFSNLVLENVPYIDFEDESRKREILAEAHFLRAFYYFDLVNSFGGVPIIDRPLDIGEYNVPRSSKEECYTFIEDDLKAAIADLPSRFDRDASYLGRADKGAALGMMMRVSIFQNKMTQVETYGNQLFTLGHTLTPDYSTIFQPEGEWNSGSLFEINFSSDASVLGTGVPKRVNPISNRAGGFVNAREDLRNEYEENDPRFDATLYFASQDYGTEWFVRKYAWEPYSNYPRPSIGGDNNSANNIRVIRLADAYLMYAEAIYDSKPGIAVEYVNKVRTRARGTQPPTVVPNLPSSLSGQALLDAIYHERRVELAGEGLRFHDLVRTGRAENRLSKYGFDINTHVVLPIPATQITLSEGILTQNPNY